MSAYKLFETIQFLNGACLVKALKELGYTVEVGKSVTLAGFGKAEAQIVVKREQLRSCCDLGFVWTGSAFVPLINDMDVHRTLNQQWRDKLQQTYSRFCVLELLKAKNARPLKTVVLDDGTIGLQVEMEV